MLEQTTKIQNKCKKNEISKEKFVKMLNKEEKDFFMNMSSQAKKNLLERDNENINLEVLYLVFKKVMDIKGR